MDRFDAETWCDECGELGWEGVCPACVAFERGDDPIVTADAT
ncbi:MAG TPA: hypothetical protein VFG74_05825 [Miltoncostaeaceae bacterium]|jgi:hypothetical protein|nr:hypothetical protein [Miltoncostaeaceae bacterium]